MVPSGTSVAAPRELEEPPLVAGVGGSAGALPALMTLLETLGDAPLAVVVVLHLSPDHESSAVEILQRVTPLRVSQVTERMRLEAGNVYVIAPGRDLVTDDGHVQSVGPVTKRPTMVIDLFFRSLANVHRERSIGVVLSGTGRDGSLGLPSIKESGGLTIVQGDDAEYREMPQAASATGAVDLVLDAASIGRRLAEFSRSPRRLPLQVSEAPQSDDDGPVDDDSEERAFHDVLAALRVRTRHDFRHYKRGTVMRRLQRRMQVNQLETVQAYRDLVRAQPEELAPLLADMLISVTNFFRDPAAFDALERDVMPSLAQNAGEDEAIRVWIPACASGEESYSIVILLQEQIDKMTRPPRMQVFASDINDAALNHARAGVYPANIAADVSEARLLAYFEREPGDLYRVRATVREQILFARHNVLGDPPFSRLDLICCRNLLIYLDRTAQIAALETFAYALKPGGYLFLGNSESTDAAGTPFEVVNKEHRIYRLRPEAAVAAHARLPSQLVSLGAPLISASQPLPAGQANALVQEPLAALHERAVVSAAPPSVLVNADLEIERVSSGAGRFVSSGEGAPSRSLLNNVSPEIRVELRAALFRAAESRRPVRVVVRRSNDDSQGGGTQLALSVHPIQAERERRPFCLVVFDELDEPLLRPDGAGKADDQAYQGAIRHLEEENRSLKVHLQETLDGSAASNEELRASNEELQAINEELRSAKEELETSKEELQSVNEELTTVNYELRLKVDEAGRNNDDLRNLMDVSEIATVFVDPAMRVKRFTPQASKLFALIPSDIGRALLDVKTKLRYDEIVADATAVFNQLRPVERSLTTIDGEHYFARILPYRTGQDKIGGAVLTFVNVTELRRAESRVKLAEERIRDAVASSRDFAVMSLDAKGVITTWNEGAARIFGYQPSEIIGQSSEILFTTRDREAGVHDEERRVAMRDGRAAGERWQQRRDGSRFYCSGVLTPMHGTGAVGFIKIARDVSQTKETELRQDEEIALQRRENVDLHAAADVRDQFLAVMSHELKQPLNLIHVNAELLVRSAETRNIPAAVRIGHVIQRAVKAQETIVNDLLDLSRIRTGKLRMLPDRIDLVPLMQRLVQVAAAEAAAMRIRLELDVPDELECWGDPVRIEQVVWNLLGNAVKFTPADGRIVVTASLDGGEARVEVADTGIGIPEAALPTIWDLFSQHPSGAAMTRGNGGLGIGLALVREIVQSQGGRVAASSPGEGKGSTFTVWLPLRNEMLRAPPAGESPPLRGKRILLVDDDKDTLTAVMAVLETEEAQVTAAEGGAAALALLESETYDLLLSDIGMPGMSGLELIKRIRQQPRLMALQAVAVSGFARDADIREALASGFDAHVAKPMSLERLREVVAHLPAR